MLVKRLAAYTHLSSTISDIQQVIGRILRHFHTPPLFILAPRSRNFAKILYTHRTKINGLSCGEESMTICSAVLIQYQRVTDRRTDRRIDRKPVPNTYISLADACKNRLGLARVGFLPQQKVFLPGQWKNRGKTGKNCNVQNCIETPQLGVINKIF